MWQRVHTPAAANPRVRLHTRDTAIVRNRHAPFAEKRSDYAREYVGARREKGMRREDDDETSSTYGFVPEHC